jgi:DNA repair exonuclease SbcCD ATPase subunit
MTKELVSRKSKMTKLLKASLLNPKNLFVLATGFVAGIFFSYVLIPIGIMAYGILCYLDLSSEDFVKKVLKLDENGSEAALETDAMPSLSAQRKAQKLEAKELQSLQANIAATREKIQQLYDNTDDFTRALLGDFSQIENLAEKSNEFLLKAQTIRNYLSSENVVQIKQDIPSLQEKIQSVSDDFSKRQYQQALRARSKHLKSLRDIQQIYERLVSQLTNISISLDSMYSRMMKLKTSEYSLASAESDQVSSQLDDLLRDVEQLDTALTENLALPTN